MTTATASRPRVRAARKATASVPPVALLVAPEPAHVAPAVEAPKAQAKVEAPKGEMGVVQQVREALAPKARLATFLGFLLGGFVPLASFIVAHHEVDASLPLYAQIGTYLVLGALFFSAKTVYDWGKLAFNSGFKAAGFVVLVEGVMVVSRTSWLGIAALAYLVVINGIATGVRMSLHKRV